MNRFRNIPCIRRAHPPTHTSFYKHRNSERIRSNKHWNAEMCRVHIIITTAKPGSLRVPSAADRETRTTRPEHMEIDFPNELKINKHSYFTISSTSLSLALGCLLQQRIRANHNKYSHDDWEQHKILHITNFARHIRERHAIIDKTHTQNVARILPDFKAEAYTDYSPMTYHSESHDDN